MAVERTPTRKLMRDTEEVVVWCLETAEVDAHEREYLATLLSPDERARRGGLRFERDRASFTIAHGGLRLVLARELGVEPTEIRFRHNAYGRPSLAEHSELLGFNLSHCGGFMTVAVSRQGRDVGVDVEAVDRSVDVAGLARTVLSPAEESALLALPEGRRQERFFRLWTLKEAYSKARGEGLSLDLRSFWFELDLDGELRFTPPANDDRRWAFLMAAPSPRHLLAACGEVSSEQPPRFRMESLVLP